MKDLATLKNRLADAEETVRAIRACEVDAVVVPGSEGDQVFTLQGAEHSYRILIESMNEGALILTADKTILYANQRFAKMVKSSLTEVMGNSFRRFLADGDRATLRAHLKRATKSGSKFQVQLQAGDGSNMPVQISLRKLAEKDLNRATIGMVVTDLTESRRTETLLRALTHRVVEVQETERGNVALELHDNITQLLCAVLFHSQALADKLSAGDDPAKNEAVKLRVLLGQTAEEVERISHNLRPSVLDQLGLAAALRAAGTEFAGRSGVAVDVDQVQLTPRLPAGTELALYRITQEALKNVAQHARARQVTVSLSQEATFIHLQIIDDGIGFDTEHRAARRKKKSVLGLLGMGERAASVGGVLKVKSGPRTGTKIDVRVPWSPPVTAAA